MSKIVIFTDGSSRGNPGPGGWGAIVATEDNVIELGGREERTTNNRMELKAAYEALEHASGLAPTEITVYADSAYVIGGASSWGKGWRKNGWITSTKQPVLNKDLWEPFLDLLDTLPKIHWHNVGGHVGVPGNERVDEIATSFADEAQIDLYNGPYKAYGIDLSRTYSDISLQKKKAESKDRSKAKAYSYISEVDGVVEIHKTWAECEARVRGKKARFKKALSAEEEAEIIKGFS